ncbi:YciI family protein [Microbacterium halophytorum]|uniref:YciI family protein n=1 Tax=Microbacterium halophytorum TaxID=2067568 RepID=UPI000CFD5DAC|nr:YciI family protein [Microbacterium halophytorum]
MTEKFLVIHMTESTGTPIPEDEDRRMLDAWAQAGRDRLGQGSMVGGPEQAKSVMVREGRTIVTDGPFPEFKEWFAGFDLVDGESVEDVAAYMAQHPSAPQGRILVLPLVEHPWE